MNENQNQIKFWNLSFPCSGYTDLSNMTFQGKKRVLGKNDKFESSNLMKTISLDRQAGEREKKRKRKKQFDFFSADLSRLISAEKKSNKKM
jgi:hypothetical protein